MYSSPLYAQAPSLCLCRGSKVLKHDESFVLLFVSRHRREERKKSRKKDVMGQKKREQNDGVTKEEKQNLSQSHSCVAGPCSSEQPLIRLVFRGGISSQTF